jgi:REP element-mobilizing transposase RayT
MIHFYIRIYTHSKKPLFASQKIINQLNDLFFAAARKHNIELSNLNIGPYFVEFNCSCSVDYSPYKIVIALKRSCVPFNKTFPDLFSRTPSLWQSAFFCESLGKRNINSLRLFEERLN